MTNIWAWLILMGVSFTLYKLFIRNLWETMEVNINGCLVAVVWVVATFLAVIIAPSFTLIKPGTVGIVVNLFGDKKGVEDQELTVGYYFIPPWKDIYTFPTYEQNHTWRCEGGEGFSFQTMEGLSISASIGITYHLKPTEIHLLFCKYRRGMEEISHIFIRNFIRDAINRHASKLKIEDLYGSAKESFFDDVQKVVQHDLAELGIVVSRIYLIGNFVFPDRVIEALNQKIEAIQRAQQRENELREAEAQAKKDVATSDGHARSMLLTATANAKKIEMEAAAQAKANDLLSASLSPNLIKSQEIQKWDGKLPVYSGVGITPFMNVGNTKG